MADGGGTMPNNDLLNSLKGMLGDNADEKINAVMNMLKSDDIPKNIENVERDIEVSDEKGGFPVGITSNNNPSISPESLEYIGRIKSIVDEMGHANDPRSNLLLSLRPYMRDTRKRSIDNAVKILNLSRFSGLFKI